MEGEVVSYLKNFTFSELDEQKLFPAEKQTLVDRKVLEGKNIPFFINEFWTSRQRQAASLHEISYRACFKPQLPSFFIDLLTQEGDVIYDPFSGRGTTAIETGILGRMVISNDINPLSKIFAFPRLSCPSLHDIEERVESIPVEGNRNAEIDLSMFYHPHTESELVSLKDYLLQRKKAGKEDNVDSWIRMVATNRLTGHSPGFFSVYTLPPNQAVSQARQVKINRERNQVPDYRDVKNIVVHKSRNLWKKLTPKEVENLRSAAHSALFLERDARHTREIPSQSVKLTVTSPPFLDVVQYSLDNWLRCWFNGISTTDIERKITITRDMEQWESVMAEVFIELYRVTAAGGWVAFEVGEIKNGKVNLEDHVIPLGIKAGFECVGVLINRQEFTKTANIWGIKNNSRGTNSNRIVLFYKEM